MKLVIGIPATTKYTYAMSACLRRIQAALHYSNLLEGGTLLLAGDKSNSLNKSANLFKQLMPKWDVEVIQLDVTDQDNNYKDEANLTIAILMTALVSRARALNADLYWNVEADILIPPNAFELLKGALDMDKGNIYDVAVGIAVSQGGGGFLFGGGSPTRHIFPDVYPEERVLPDELKAKFEQAQKDKKVSKELMDEIEKCPPAGNIWELNAKFGWKERGWGTNYFPGISAYGAIVHTKWSGFICNLYNRKSLNLLDFTGYALKGTSDLFIVWKKLYQQGIKEAAVLHCLCDHVIRDKADKTKYIVARAFFETEPPCQGHLRVEMSPFYNFDSGERYHIKNDGIPSRPEVAKTANIQPIVPKEQ